MKFTIEELDAKTAKELLDVTKQDLGIDFETFNKLQKGDHWRNGEGWVGPKPDPSGSESANVMTRIKRQFVSKNVVNEVLNRHESGIFGKQPKINLSPSEPTKETDSLDETQIEEIKALEADIMEWFRNRKVIEKLREGVRHTLYGKKATFRFYIPKAFLGEDSRLGDIEEFADALDKIHLDVYNIEDATVVEEPDTLRQVGIFVTKDEDDNEVVEITFVADEESGEGAGSTFVKTFSDGDEGGGETEPLPLHGNILMYQVERTPIISNQVRQQQDLLNKSLTMWSANMDWSGFVERIVLNGMPPGKWGYDATEQKWEYEQIGDMKSGPATTNFISGVPQFDDQGRIAGMSTPSVQFRDPIEPDTFKTTTESAYRSILEEAHQVHILLSSQAEASGISRREARQDYEEDLKTSKGSMDLAGKWIVETLIYLGQFLAGTEEDEPKYKVEFSSNINVGPISQEDSEMILTQVEKGLKSKETAMSELGIDDVEAELTRIDSASDQVEKILELLTLTQIKSPTMARKLFEIIMNDIEIFSTFEEAERNAILDEIESSVGQAVQEADFMSGMRGSGAPEEEEDEEEEETE